MIFEVWQGLQYVVFLTNFVKRLLQAFPAAGLSRVLIIMAGCAQQSTECKPVLKMKASDFRFYQKTIAIALYRWRANRNGLPAAILLSGFYLVLRLGFKVAGIMAFSQLGI